MSAEGSGCPRSGRANAAAAQPAQGPVDTGPQAVGERAARRPRSARRSRRAGPRVVAANTVVTTRPAPSTIGPPELPERTSPRSAVIERSTGPRP